MKEYPEAVQYTYPVNKSSFIKGLGWERYDNEEDVKNPNNMGRLWVIFYGKRGDNVYTYENVTYRQYYYFLKSAPSKGKYLHYSPRGSGGLRLGFNYTWVGGTGGQAPKRDTRRPAKKRR